MEHLRKLGDFLGLKRRRTDSSYERVSHLNAEAFHAPLSPPDLKFQNTRKRPREDDSPEVSPDESASQVSQNEESIEPSSSDQATEEGHEMEVEDEEEVESEISPNDKVQEYLDRQAELALKRDEIEKVKSEGSWHAEEIYLFERLTMRNHEELLPVAWQIDFDTLPPTLFTQASEKAFIDFNHASSSRAVKELKNMLELGRYVKEKIELGLPCEKMIEKEIQRYIRWSEVDGGIDKLRFLPVLTVVAGRPDEATASISKRITDQMDFLAKQHRHHLREPEATGDSNTERFSRMPPLLYGIIVAQTFVIFVTLDSSQPEGKLRTLAHFDLKDPNGDIWNGLAIAIIVIIARNHLLSIKGEFEEDEEPESDPDA